MFMFPPPHPTQNKNISHVKFLHISLAVPGNDPSQRAYKMQQSKVRRVDGHNLGSKTKTMAVVGAFWSTQSWTGHDNN